MKFNSRVVAIVVSIAIAAFTFSAFAGWRSAIDPLAVNAPEPDWLLLIGLAVTAVGLFSQRISAHTPLRKQVAPIGVSSAFAGD